MSTGPDEEFDAFMRGRWPAMVRLGYALTGDVGHAEDLAQAAFARAYASWGRVRRAGDPDAYVRRIVINEHRGQFRKHRVAEELRGDLGDAVGGQQEQQPLDDRRTLLDALRALGPRQRAVVVLRYWLDLSEAETVAAVAAGYPALSGSAAAPPAPATGPGPAPSPSQGGMAVSAYPAPDATEAPGGLASKAGEIAAGSVGDMKWKVYVVPPGPKNPVKADSCYAVSVNVGSDITGNCNDIPAQLGRGLGASQPAAFMALSRDSATATVVGLASADVTYLIVTFADGQQLKLIPVTAGGHRYVAWMAPLSMTVASVTAHLGGPYSDSGQTAVTVPFQRPGWLPAFGLWQQEGDTAPPRDTQVIAAVTVNGRASKVTAYEGPWGTCFVADQPGDQPGGLCVPVAKLATTTLIDFVGASRQQVGFGAAAPGVASVRVTLSDGKAVTTHPVGVGNEDLFAFPVSKGVTPVSWTAYDAAGRQVGAGSTTHGSAVG